MILARLSIYLLVFTVTSSQIIPKDTVKPQVQAMYQPAQSSFDSVEYFKLLSAHYKKEAARFKKEHENFIPVRKANSAEIDRLIEHLKKKKPDTVVIILDSTYRSVISITNPPQEVDPPKKKKGILRRIFGSN